MIVDILEGVLMQFKSCVEELGMNAIDRRSVL